MDRTPGRAIQDLVAKALHAVQEAQMEALTLPADTDRLATDAINRALADASHELATSFYALAALDRSMAGEA